MNIVMVSSLNKITQSNNFLKLSEEIRKYKSKHYQVILLSCENVGAMEHLCDDVIYVADGKVKLGSLTSGVPMLYAVERIVGILTKEEIEN